jgi:hypothetical protein
MLHFLASFISGRATGVTPAPDHVEIIANARRSGRVQAGAAANSFASAPHIAFALTFRPCQRLFHRLALMVSQAHFRQDGLRIDLLGDLRRRRRRGD